MRICSFIPARGGSKGIPHKNIIDLNGLPLICYSINASLASNVDETWVSTDSEAIRDVAELHGANVLRRPAEISGDDCPTEAAIEHFIDNIEPDIVVFLQATSPMTLAEDINKGLDLMSTKQYDSLFSAVKSNDILVWNDKMEPLNYDPQHRGDRQHRSRYIYIETGGFYIFTSSFFRQTGCRMGGRIGVVEIPFWRSFEIDAREDLHNIERLIP
jgi:CMP-N,N'-diacetyllegionaminic acid synthase